MDLTALQATLREFAAQRGWQPFHTPKNLAMALMVEAAELAEIFQWMTPEQSQAAGADPALRERIADEVADVLLYLVQVADHSGVDFKRAVGRKLVKNARKHPVPAGRATAAGAAPAPMAAQRLPVPAAETHVLLDWENVQPDEAALRALVPGVTEVWLFHGPNQRAFAVRYASFGDRLHTIKIARTGRNALDFHLSFYLGRMAAEHPGAQLVVVSNDQGYGSMVEHAATLGFAVRHVGLGAATAAPTPLPAKTVPSRPAPARKSAGKKVPASKAPGKDAVAPPAAPDNAGAVKAAASAPAKAPAQGAAAEASAVLDLTKATRHVAASLAKTDSKPTRQARLRAMIRSLLGNTTDDRAVHAVLARLLASGRVAIDSKGAVTYPPMSG